MKQLVIGLLVLALGGCAASAKPVQSANNAQQEKAFASALCEAFEVYEREVQVASSLSYASEAEARAVVASLSEDRFDYQLEQALARRGLRLSDLSQYAAEHPTFFHEQQTAHWGRLESLEQKVDAIASSVKLSDSEVLALTAGLSD